MKYCVLILLLALGPLTKGATWYVDLSASGDGNGSSWSDAWTNLASIAWASVKPGDTIEIATGNYGTWFAIGAGGVSGSPVTIAMAEDEMHRGPVLMQGINIGSKSWVTINGSLDPLFDVPRSVHDLDQMTNNIGIHLSNTNGPGVFTSGGYGQRILWVHTEHCGSDAKVSNEDGISFNAAVGESEVGYCWIQDQIYGDGINVSNTKNKTWGDLSIHHCLITNVGDDGVQCPGGVDVYCCKITGKTRGHAAGHGDALQTWGTNVRFHHNIVGDFQAAGGGYASWAYAQFSYPVVGNYLVYNNLFRDELRPTSAGFAMTFDAWWSPGKHNENAVITNILFANNLFCATNHRATGFSLSFDADKARGTNDHYTITNCYFLNNIVIDTYRQYRDGGVFGFSGPADKVDISYESFPLDHNVITGPNWHFYYLHTTVSRAEVLTADPLSPYKHNTSQRPHFVNYNLGQPPFDFHLMDDDTIARDAGMDLSRFLAMAPMIDVDLDGRQRDALWDIGPYEYPATEPDPPIDCDEARRQLAEALEQIRILESK